MQMIAERGSSEGLDLTYADLREAKLGSSLVKMPSLTGVRFGEYGDVLSGADARGAMFQRTEMRRAKLLYGDFRDANFYRCDLSDSDLRFASFEGAIMVETNLTGANLCGSDFHNANFRGAFLERADLYLAKFSGATNLAADNIGKRILQEDKQEYAAFIERSILPDSSNPLETHLSDRYYKAGQIYRRLRTHFGENGLLDDARWAFLRERRMYKLWAGQQTSLKLRGGDLKSGLEYAAEWLTSWLAEILCDYGESVWRVALWLSLLLFLVGPATVKLLGGLIWPSNQFAVYQSLPSEAARWFYIYYQYLLFTLDTLTTSNYSVLLPGGDAVRLLSGILSLTGIFLAGLLGFVVGNRIRKL